MKRALTYLLAFIIGSNALPSKAQTTCEVPMPPVLTSVSINSASGFTELKWTLSPSPGIAAYIIYSHTNGYGIPVDTIWDPAATSYSFYSSGIKYFSESYVVAAFRKPICTSPLSNILSTIYCTAILDTCQKKIEIKWNRHADYPFRVTGYDIIIKKNGVQEPQTISTGYGSGSFVLTDFEADIQYCFTVRAIMENGSPQGSNTPCIITAMQKAPRWINADFATVTGNNEVALSFTIDPSSELRSYILERKKASVGSFEKISQFSNIAGKVAFTDQTADLSTVYSYRLAALNNCNIPIVRSNNASNLVLELKQDPSDIILTWNKYRSWTGMTDRYEVYTGTEANNEKISTVTSSDTTVAIPYSSLMYRSTGTELCFFIKAFESANPYGISGISQSVRKCIPPTEVITIPNAFTPDNDLVNDLFKPVLSFIPLSYRIVITDMKRRVVFESDDPYEEWDGTLDGVQLPDGVYLFQLKLVPPSGKIITKSGTLAIIRIR